MKRRLFEASLLLCFLTSCSQLEEVRLNDIKRGGGLYYETEKLINYGIVGVRVDESDNVHFYVEEIKPDTREKIENGLISIYGRTFDFQLHERE